MIDLELLSGDADDEPLIHCITNPISMTQCANAILTIGGKPIMAEHPLEVEEITATADALLLNLGNISDVRMKSMEVSFHKALEKGIPVVIDAVGVACSRLRLEFIRKLLEIRERLQKEGIDENYPLVIKGNYSEIMALWDKDYRGKGVDADSAVGKEDILKVSRLLAGELGCIVLASGKADVVTDGEAALCVENGTKAMGLITGTGCMLGAICAVFLTREKASHSERMYEPVEASKKNYEMADGLEREADQEGAGEHARVLEEIADACAFFGVAGELAEERVIETGRLLEEPESGFNRCGNGSFFVALMDELSLMTNGDFLNRKKVIRVVDKNRL